MNNKETRSPSLYLVTGACGFIGASLVTRLLQLGHYVYGLDILPSERKASNYVHLQIDLLAVDPVELFSLTGEVNFIIHLAARTDLNGARLSDYTANTVGVQVMCDYAHLNKSVSALFASTQLVNKLGDCPTSLCDYSPDSYYGLSKVIGESIVSSSFRDSPNVRWIIFRPTTVWGPGMSSHYQRFLSLLAKRRYFHFGNSSCLKSFSFIDNATSQIIDLSINSSRYSSSLVCYLCDEAPVNIIDWANDLAVSIKARPPLTLPRFAALILSASNDFLSRLLGFNPPLLPLTFRRYTNIITPYLYDSRLLWRSPACESVPYSLAIKKTAEWFLALRSAEEK